MSIFDHVSIGVGDFAAAVKFYDAVMAALGYERVSYYEEHGAVAYGKPGGYPDFWVQKPIDGKPASSGNGTHLCFKASSEDAVKAFHAKALELGGSDEGAPGPRPMYGPEYYGGFVKDPSGNKLEAVYFSKPHK